MSHSLSHLVLEQASNGDLAAQMAEFYRRIDQRIADQRPLCVNRGDCCRFGEYGHRLYVTPPELAYFARGHADNWRPTGSRTACPFQVDGKCTARDHRPLGCRIFFCDSNSAGWQNPEYERGLVELKRIGATFGMDYQYTEWLSALMCLDSAFQG